MPLAASLATTIPAASPLRDFAIPVERMGALEIKLARLARKAEKLGLVAPILHRVRVEHRALPNRTDEGDGYSGRFVELQIVTVEGEAPQLAGWTLLARLERLPNTTANLIHSASSSVDLPETFRTAAPACDHCKTRRNRKDTFVVRHEDHRVLQVGSSCLADFLGHESPEALVAACTSYFEFIGACEDEDSAWWSTRHPDCWTLSEYLPWVYTAILMQGWRSRTKAHDEGGTATADIALSWMTTPPSDRTLHKIPNHPDAEGAARAQAAIAWASALEARTDYEHNVKTLALSGYTSIRSTGIAASILPGYDRHLAHAREEAARLIRPSLSEHVGTVGERLRDLRLTVLRVIDLEGEFGVSHLTLMEDSDGRSFKWFSSSKKLEEGQTYNVDGTVKKHEEYKGKRGTLITRCAAFTDAELEAAELAQAKFIEEKRLEKIQRKAILDGALEDGAKKVAVSALCEGMILVASYGQGQLKPATIRRIDARGEDKLSLLLVGETGYSEMLVVKKSAKVVVSPAVLDEAKQALIASSLAALDGMGL